MKITKTQLKRIINEARWQFDPSSSYDMSQRQEDDYETDMIDSVDLVYDDGTRTKLGFLLAMTAKNGQSGLETSMRNVRPLLDAGLITFGLHPRGGLRAVITDRGLRALANT